jgi:signal transduction histidine kinase
LDGLVTSSIWIVDRNVQTISVGEGDAQFNYSELPSEADEIIRKVLEGHVTTSEDFSLLLNEPSITVGAPVYDQNNQVIAAVLLHSSLEGKQEVITQGIKLLVIAGLAAMLVSVVFTVLLSMHFIRPIRAMQIAANHMADGDYQVSTQVHRRDELGALANDIDILAERLHIASQESAQVEQMRRDFVSNVSHELRTPVTVLRSSLEALCEGVVLDHEEVKNYHDCMLTETIHLQRMITDLLDLSRLQNTDFAMEMAQIDLVQVARDALRAAQQLAQIKGIVLTFQSSCASASILGDYGRIRQLILILLDNAIKFSPEESKVDLSIEHEENEWRITVSDQGEGIAEKDLLYVFERFYKASDTVNPQGNGLGLCIAKQIALRHQAMIFAYNLPKRGCQIMVKFSPYCTE